MSEKESLVDIFQRIYRKHAGKFNDPDPNENGFFEMKKAPMNMQAACYLWTANGKPLLYMT